jgi:Holliday junction resolvasome RuvABC ATP-dependent DNA helicase subunit
MNQDKLRKQLALAKQYKEGKGPRSVVKSPKPLGRTDSSTQTLLPVQIPGDFLSPMLGHPLLKERVSDAVGHSGKEVRDHMIFVGPPGCGKTVMLMEIERLEGAKTAVGANTTATGLRNLLIKENPRFLLVDEIEKMARANPVTISILLEWLNTGRIITTTHKGRTVHYNYGTMFAAANTIERLPPELIDRLDTFFLPEFKEDQFHEVVTALMVNRYHRSEEMAEYVSAQVWEFDRSVRTAVRMGVICDTKEKVDMRLKSLRMYSSQNYMGF